MMAKKLEEAASAAAVSATEEALQRREEAALRRPAETLPAHGACDPGLLTAAASREQWRHARHTVLARSLQTAEARLGPARQDLAVAHGRELALDDIADKLDRRRVQEQQRRVDDAPPASRPRPGP